MWVVFSHKIFFELFWLPGPLSSPLSNLMQCNASFCDWFFKIWSFIYWCFTTLDRVNIPAIFVYMISEFLKELCFSFNKLYFHRSPQKTTCVFPVGSAILLVILAWPISKCYFFGPTYRNIYSKGLKNRYCWVWSQHLSKRQFY